MLELNSLSFGKETWEKVKPLSFFMSFSFWLLLLLILIKSKKPAFLDNQSGLCCKSGKDLMGTNQTDQLFNSIHCNQVYHRLTKHSESRMSSSSHLLGRFPFLSPSLSWCRSLGFSLLSRSKSLSRFSCKLWRP